MRVDDILLEKNVRTVFQPIVDLDQGTVVAYEALSRGPVGELEQPDLLFRAAAAQGRLAELDALCRSAALRNAVLAGLASPTALFVNVEPAVLDAAPLDELIQIADSAPGGLQVVLEITERAISARPAELLACVRRLRAAGWRIALDDVGADDMSLAFMPLLRPDIVKLDIKLVQERPGPAVAGIMNAVNAYAQRTGAVLLAEGIENEEHLEIARALGAQLGQGWMFGRPSPPLNTALPVGGLELPAAVPVPTESSPFACLPPGTKMRQSAKPLLMELSRHLEQEALRHGSTCIVAATFQYARHFTPATRERYRRLAETVGFVAAIGHGLAEEPVAGVRGANLAEADALRNEWDIVVLAPHFAAALLARDLGDTGPDRERSFEFALTYDRDTVSSAAQALLSRVLPHDVSERIDATASSSAGPAVSEPASRARPVPDNDQVSVLRRALAASSNGITIADATRPDMPLIYVNAAFERLSGLTEREILGMNCRTLQGEDTDRRAIDRIRAAIADGVECRETILNYRRGTNEPWWNEIFLAPVFDDDGQLVQYIGVQNDVTARITAEIELDKEQRRSAAYLREMESLAFHDPLTGLLNRRRLTEQLTSTLAQARADRTGVGFLYVDVDGFKQINDTHGHALGDGVLVDLAARLLDVERADSFAARLGGDEFLIVLPGLAPHAAQQDTERAAAALRERLRHDAPTVRVSVTIGVSIGVSVFPQDGGDFDALLHAADTRMYDDKAAKRQQLSAPPTPVGA